MYSTYRAFNSVCRSPKQNQTYLWGQFRKLATYWKPPLFDKESCIEMCSEYYRSTLSDCHLSIITVLTVATNCEREGISHDDGDDAKDGGIDVHPYSDVTVYSTIYSSSTLAHSPTGGYHALSVKCRALEYPFMYWISYCSTPPLIAKTLL